MFYPHQELIIQNYASESDGYWLFEPTAPKPDSADVIVFIHGYGAIDPLIYGKWIRHLVLQGNIVIYPRYQKNLVSPGTKAFAGNAAKAIRDALTKLEEEEHVRDSIMDEEIIIEESENDDEKYMKNVAQSLQSLFQERLQQEPAETVVEEEGSDDECE